METELWFNLRAAWRRRIPVMLANARLSERSARRYACLPALTALTLPAQPCGDRAQTAADAARLAQPARLSHGHRQPCRHRPAVAPFAGASGRSLRERIGARPVLLAASTREGEEALLFDAFARPCRPRLCCCWCRATRSVSTRSPRSPARGLQRCSGAARTTRCVDARVLLGDLMGESPPTTPLPTSP